MEESTPVNNNTYEYKVLNLQKNENGIIVFASFQITVSDGVDSFTHNFATAFNNKPVTPVAYDDLTEEKVISWIKNTVGKNSEESADAELQAYKERKSISSGALPW